MQKKRALISLAISSGLLLVIGLLFKLTDHNYAHVWQGSDFHIALGFGWLWPYFLIRPVEGAFSHPWLMYAVIVAIDLLVYFFVCYSVLSICTKSSRKAYNEK